jgi:TPR repeat protein
MDKILEYKNTDNWNKYFLKLIKLADANNIEAIETLIDEFLKLTQKKITYTDEFVSKIKKGVENNGAYSTGMLGTINLVGNGTDQRSEKDIDEALRLYDISNNLNNIYTMDMLGKFYELGLYVEKDIFKAVELYKKGIELKNSLSYVNLANILVDGNAGIDKDVNRAIELLKKSLELKPINSTFKRLMDVYKKECDGEDNSEDIFNLATLGTNKGIRYAHYILGGAYALGMPGIVEPDENKSLEILQKGLDLGDPYCKCFFGSSYIKGDIKDKNILEGVELLKDAAKSGVSEAMVELGMLYEDGIHVDQDYTKAVNYYKNAAELNNPDGMNNYAIMLDQGLGVERNRSLAMKNWILAGSMNCEEAIINGEICYEKGGLGEPIIF